MGAEQGSSLLSKGNVSQRSHALMEMCCKLPIEEASFRNMKYIQELDHQRERVQKTPMTGASYKSHHVDVVVVAVEVRWE